MQIYITVAMFSLLPALGSACAVYSACLCQNADGSCNDGATKTVYGEHGGNYDEFDDGRHYCRTGGGHAGAGGGFSIDFNNCLFQKSCASATGDDSIQSNCWIKV
ncbi:hypothetical protein Slin14017_G085090 [Septoria linicola]|nr:hypothetical protein Slin14017_G085090 [Septoria linicola]